MRFIKRLLFVILLLVIAFFVYRLINPTAANSLLHDIKSFSNDKIGTHFSLDTKTIAASWAVSSWTVSPWSTLSNSSVNITWNILNDSGDELLLTDINASATWISATWSLSKDTSSVTTSAILSPKDTTSCPAMPTVSLCPSDQEKYVSYSSTDCGTYYACKSKTPAAPKTSASSSHKWLSSQDIRDLKNLFWN